MILYFPSLPLLFQVELNPKHFIRVVLARLTIHYTLVNSVQEVSATASAKNLIGHRYSSHQISFTFITGGWFVLASIYAHSVAWTCIHRHTGKRVYAPRA